MITEYARRKMLEGALSNEIVCNPGVQVDRIEEHCVVLRAVLFKDGEPIYESEEMHSLHVGQTFTFTEATQTIEVRFSSA